jgi:hypothetical protein
MSHPEISSVDISVDLARENARRQLDKLGYNIHSLEPEQHLEVSSLEHLVVAFDAGVPARFCPPLDSEKITF